MIRSIPSKARSVGALGSVNCIRICRNLSSRYQSWRSMLRNLLLVFVAIILGTTSGKAFPPTPHHIIYGMVRDEMGNPVSLENAIVILETAASSKVVARILPGLVPGVNYRMSVPLDASVTSDSYRPNALRSQTPYRLQVQIGQSIYLPIEMLGDFSILGQSAESQRVDLTLGEDSDRDGLPDAWERALLAASKGALSEVNPDDDSDNDGLSNLEEYHTGTFAYDVDDGFSLKISEFGSESLSLEFMSIRGRNYEVFASSDLNDWQPVSFQLEGEGAESGDRSSYQAEVSKVVHVSVNASTVGPVLRFYKLRVK